DFSQYPCEQNRLLLSQPDGRYRDATAESLPPLADFSHGSSVADIDGDGDIDIWVNNLGCSSGISGYLLQNDGIGRIKIIADLVLYQNPAGFDPATKLQILISNGDGTFRDETASRLPAQISQGITAPEVRAGDIDGDHLEDLLVSLFRSDFSEIITDFYIDRG